MTTFLKIDGMSCKHCAAAVKTALESVAGVTHVQVRLDTGNAEVEHDLTANRTEMIRAVDEEGYSATLEAKGE